MYQEQDLKYNRAKRRVAEIKGFRIHFTIYLMLNLLIALGNGISNDAAGKAIFQSYMLFTPVFWGIGLGIHALRVFVGNRVFGSTWEARQIAKFMKEEQQRYTSDSN
jgi:hypothetical protein